MGKELENIQIIEDKNDPQEDKPKETEKLKKILLTGGIILLIGIGVAWKCWDGQRVDLRKLSTDELKNLRDKLQEVILSPGNDQLFKNDCIKWRDIIDKMIRAREPVDMKTYIYPKGGEYGTNLWKPD